MELHCLNTNLGKEEFEMPPCHVPNLIKIHFWLLGNVNQVWSSKKSMRGIKYEEETNTWREPNCFQITQVGEDVAAQAALVVLFQCMILPSII